MTGAHATTTEEEEEEEGTVASRAITIAVTTTDGTEQ